jgi:hypothetical protein
LPTTARVTNIGMKAKRQIKKLISSTGYLFTKFSLIIESTRTNNVYPEKPSIKPKALLLNSKLYFTISTNTNYERCWKLKRKISTSYILFFFDNMRSRTGIDILSLSSGFF